jgi:hypothetical protein
MTMPKAYTVHVAASRPPLDEALLEALVDLFAGHPGYGAAVSWGGLAGGPAVQLTLEAATLPAAVLTASERLKEALGQLGIVDVEIVEAEAMTEELLERRLAREPELYVGVSEIAEILGVSRQRVSEIRLTLADFPRPIAELAAGPVWTRSSLNHFLENWARRPGRPSKEREARKARIPEIGRRAGMGQRDMPESAPAREAQNLDPASPERA